eukprot:gene11487-15386_t
MGRVRRYKKFKACDPFSKNHGKKDVVDDNHDEPPDSFEQRALKKQKLRESWNTEEKQELLLQREALRSLKTTDEKKIKKIEPKGVNESLRDFKKRIREETRQTLNEELGKLSTTAIKRKEKLKERNKAKKLKKKNPNHAEESFDEEVVEFNLSKSHRLQNAEYDSEDDDRQANLHKRSLNYGKASSSFPGLEAVPFGETASRPPDLKQFTNKFTKMISHNNQNQVMNRKQLTSNDKLERNDDNEEENNEIFTKKKRKREAYRDDMDGDDGLEISQSNRNDFNKQIFSKNNNSNKTANIDDNNNNNNTKVSSLSSLNEMELLRNKVMEAYHTIRDKRKQANESKYNK